VGGFRSRAVDVATANVTPFVADCCRGCYAFFTGISPPLCLAFFLSVVTVCAMSAQEQPETDFFNYLQLIGWKITDAVWLMQSGDRRLFWTDSQGIVKFGFCHGRMSNP
jgi:hypothetical protein